MVCFCTLESVVLPLILSQVFVNDKKFAWYSSWFPSLSCRCLISYSEACIKGHRSSSCTHADRPLYEIKKKGRPVSQCARCRELRSTKKVHSKCTCANSSRISSTHEN